MIDTQKKAATALGKAADVLIIADSEHSADMLYATGMFVPDPFIYLRLKGREYLCMSDLELDRAAKEAPHCEILSLTRIQGLLKKQGMDKAGWGEVAAWILQKKRVTSIAVPNTFPLKMAQVISQRIPKIQLHARDVFPERMIKTPKEVRLLGQALRMTEVGLKVAIRTLKQSKKGARSVLQWRGAALTSERLRSVIHTAICQEGGQASNTIVAGGNQGCDPHDRGSGPLKADVPIILDIFPRVETTGYFGDMTRTVVRGKASEAVRKQYAAVMEAQESAIHMARDGVSGHAIHEQVESVFATHGYQSGRIKGRMSGFFHGTGHGLGLEIHEWPRMGRHSSDIMRAGHVMTVEPGLYYHGTGGVRLEDVILIRKGKPRILSQFEKVLEI